MSTVRTHRARHLAAHLLFLTRADSPATDTIPAFPGKENYDAIDWAHRVAQSMACDNVILANNATNADDDADYIEEARTAALAAQLLKAIGRRYIAQQLAPHRERMAVEAAA